MVKLKVLQWCIDEHGLIRTHDPLPLSRQARLLTRCRSQEEMLGCLPDIEGAFLIGSQGPGPGAHAVVHHLLS